MPDDLKKELKHGFYSRAKFAPALVDATPGERAYLVHALTQQMVVRDGRTPAQVERYVKVGLQMTANAQKPDLIYNGCPRRIFVSFKMRES